MEIAFIIGLAAVFWEAGHPLGGPIPVNPPFSRPARIPHVRFAYAPTI